MSVTSIIEGNKLIIKIEGNLTASLHQEFRDAYKNKLGIKEYIVDLGESDYADSSGLGLLLSLYSSAKIHARTPVRFCIINCNQQLKEIMKIGSINTFFQI